MSENHMQFPQKAPGFPQWNLNTIVQLIGLALIAFTAAGVWFGQSNDVSGLVKWRGDLEASLKERRGEVESDFARIGAQIISLDDRLDVQEATASRLSDRVSAGEARGNELAQGLRDLQSAISAQGGDLKVILAWIEEQRRQAPAKR